LRHATDRIVISLVTWIALWLAADTVHAQAPQKVVLTVYGSGQYFGGAPPADPTIQETLRNVVRHSGASHAVQVWIPLEARTGRAPETASGQGARIG
jgi:hypothetical protein